MRPHAILVNTSRGPVVDERALYRALTEGWIARAGLDVIESEPLDPDNPLLDLDNVVITPHTGGYADLYHPEAYWLATAEAAIALARGHWPKSVLNRGEVTPKWPLK
jgi:phosphoglycerate dehydrogenase-like enzyme